MGLSVSMGYNTGVQWIVESTYAEGADTTVDLKSLKSIGLTKSVELSSSVEREDAYGIESQNRINDPIINEIHELTITTYWQGAATETVYEFLKSALTAQNSYVIRIEAKPDGSTSEFLYLEGCTLTGFSITSDTGAVVEVELTIRVAEIYSNDWVAVLTESATGTTDTTDPTVYHDLTITFPAGLLAIASELQAFSFEVNFNNIEIKNYSSPGIVGNPQGGIEITFSFSAYGDGTTQGATALLSKLLGDGSGTITWADGGVPKTFTLAGCSYDSINTPINEKELIVLEGEGKANTVALD
jgi:hypothetical protein